VFAGKHLQAMLPLLSEASPGAQQPAPAWHSILRDAVLRSRAAAAPCCGSPVWSTSKAAK